jgi:integrative and conjugative element protein (TIGR02256 family)
MKFTVEPFPWIEISDAALDRIKALSAESREAETGGILVGFHEGHNIRITAASEAGPKAQTSQGHFTRDTEYCRVFLSNCYSETGADYIGEWHSHVVSLHQLSLGDIGTIAQLFVDPDYDFVTFALILVVATDVPELHVYVAQRKLSETKFLTLEIAPLYGGPFPR